MRDCFAFSDIHGMYDLYKAIMNYCMKQDPEATIIFCGDACDRGRDGYKIMRELLDNPNVVYLKGNHEDMFVKAARFIMNDYTGANDQEEFKRYLYSLYIGDGYVPQVQDCIYNGGMPTLVEWFNDDMSNEFVSRIAARPLTFSIDTMDFCHAGACYKAFENVANDEHDGEIPDKEDEELLLWDRNYLGLGWRENRICVYGHTPVYHLPVKYCGQDNNKMDARPCMYQGQLDNKWTGKKINMDVGTYNTHRLYVLNCLTLKAQGFQQLKNGTVEQIKLIQL